MKAVCGLIDSAQQNIALCHALNLGRTGGLASWTRWFALGWLRTIDANLLAAPGAWCVPIVRTSVARLAPTGISRASGCVTIVREAVREGSFMGFGFHNQRWMRR